MTYPASRKRGEEVQVGDLVRYKEADHMGAGLVTNVRTLTGPDEPLWETRVTVLWPKQPSTAVNPRYLEVVSESR
jgi:hypothetical protein